MAGYLSREAIHHWRGFSALDGWNVKPLPPKIRDLCAKLAPPFDERGEIRIFDVPYYEGQIKAQWVEFAGRTVWGGFFFATESRLIFGDEGDGLVAHIMYGSIEAVYPDGELIKLSLAGGGGENPGQGASCLESRQIRDGDRHAVRIPARVPPRVAEGRGIPGFPPEFYRVLQLDR